MFGKFGKIFTILLFTFVCTGCSSSAENSAPSKLVIAGSTTLQPLVEILAEKYQEENVNVLIDIQAGGSSVGVTSVRNELAQIGMVSRELKAGESSLFVSPIAYDGISLIVHNSNPIQSLSKEQIVHIYAGQITNWQELGGDDVQITVVNKEQGRGTLAIFENHFDLKGKITNKALIIGPNGQAIATTANNPGAISYVPIAAALSATNEGSMIRTIQLDGIDPTVENVQSQIYPLRRKLNLVTVEQPTALSGDFINFIYSPQGQNIVSAQGFVPFSRR